VKLRTADLRHLDNAFALLDSIEYRERLLILHRATRSKTGSDYDEYKHSLSEMLTMGRDLRIRAARYLLGQSAELKPQELAKIPEYLLGALRAHVGYGEGFTGDITTESPAAAALLNSIARSRLIRDRSKFRAALEKIGNKIGIGGAELVTYIEGLGVPPDQFELNEDKGDHEEITLLWGALF